MYFKPIDEMSLRHLAASSYGEKVLGISYLGPALNDSNAIETSPDCLVVDKREAQWQVRRCEFKHVVSSKNAFADNGFFEMAIVWSIEPPLNRQTLREQLAEQNSCSEVIVLSERKAFSDLEDYHVPSREELHGIPELRSVVLRMSFPTVFAAYVAASLSPLEFDMSKMTSLLSEKFPEVRRMHPQGRGNVVAKLLQTKPPLIKWLHGSSYCWEDRINPHLAVKEIEELIRTRFREEVPSRDILAEFRA